MAIVWIILMELFRIRIASCGHNNMALGKPVNMSSIYQKLGPERAVDGYTTAVFPYGIHTKPGQPLAWWTVDLQSVVRGATVKIYFRTNYTARSNGVQLYTAMAPFSTYPGGHWCHTFTGNSIPNISSVNCPGTWRYLMVYTETDNDGSGPVLDFGEVEVLECPNGTYGLNCEKNCSDRHCMTSSSSCERETGQCPDGCLTGWEGQDCIHECSAGTYGLNCTKFCSSRNCQYSSPTCDAVSGMCSPCNPGYEETDCSECSSDNYGAKCDKSCSSRHWLGPATTCDRLTGACPVRCQHGWTGIDCVTAGSYGAGCTSSCTSRQCLTPSNLCHHVTGNCTSGCKPGWMGNNCTHSCTAYKYEVNCNKICSDRRCNTRQSACDRVTGRCPDGCEIGWTGIDCSEQCPVETYGKECLNCSSRHCSGDQTCPPDGRCPQGCQSGWIGDSCTEKCPSGLYGVGCSSSCGQCRNNDIYDHVTGNCSQGCKPGRMPGLCQSSCDRELYGPDCTRKCVDRHCVSSSTCNPSIGECHGGCQKGWTGIDCMETSSPSIVNHIPIVAGVAAAVVLTILIVIISVVMWRKRRRSERKSAPDHVNYTTGSENRQSISVGSCDRVQSMSGDDEGTYTTIDPIDHAMAIASSPEYDVTARDEYKPVSENTYDKNYQYIT